MIADLPLARVSSIIVTKISRRFTHKMAATNGGHRYETKIYVAVTLRIYIYD